MFAVVHEGDAAESGDLDDLQVEAPLEQLGQHGGVILLESGDERQEIVIVRGHDEYPRSHVEGDRDAPEVAARGDARHRADWRYKVVNLKWQWKPLFMIRFMIQLHPPSTPTLMAFTGVTSAHTYYNGIQTQIILGEGKHTDYLTILRGP